VRRPFCLDAEGTAPTCGASRLASCQVHRHKTQTSTSVGLSNYTTYSLTHDGCCVVVLCVLVADGPSGLHRYKLRLLFDAVEMRWDWPVDVNYHEAQVRTGRYRDRTATGGQSAAHTGTG